MTVAGRTAWTVLFSLAFGWVEAAVVIYLRRLYYPTGFALPLRTLDPTVLATELVRELATLLMLLAVACLAGRSRWQRFAFFALAFGVWDLAYYIGLKIALGWPASLTDWDVLFLLPWPWLAPVYAPVSVALILCGAGWTVVHLLDRGHAGRADRWAWLLGAAGVAILLYSFLHDTAAGLQQVLPRPYPVGLLIVGGALLVACLWRFVRLSRREKDV